MKNYRTLSQSPANPAAGAGAVITPSPVQRVKISSLIATFTASATIANRMLFAQLLDPNNVPVFETGSTTAITAGTAADIVLSPAFSQPTTIQGPVNQGFGLGIPNIWLPPAWRLKLNAVGIQAGDQFSGITFIGEFAEDIWDQEEHQALALAFLSSLVN